MDFLKHIENKIGDFDTLGQKLLLWRFHNDKVVFTNGCFDLLHAGHVQYLAQARSLGNRLILGLNSDASVNQLKGNHRPINDEKTRSFVLAALEIIDFVIVFDDETPMELIEKIRPDVLVKGGDYTIDSIVGAEYVLKQGGEVKVLSFLEGYSTTNIEQKIKATN